MEVLILDDHEDFALRFKDKLNSIFTYLISDDIHFTLETSPANLNKRTYDFAFVDIDLGIANGIEVSKVLKDSLLCTNIVFVSSLSNLVIQSFVAHPFFFIRKEYLEEDLIMFQSLLYSYLAEQGMQVFSFKEANTNITIPYKEIIYIETLAHNLHIVTPFRDYSTRIPLKEFQKKAPSSFVQIHRCYVVNLDHITNFNTYNIEMNNGISLPIGRNYKSLFIEAYEKHLLS